jgi:SWI/SNF-related matrix-associated actin-dependent regulator 1 of chromatin subfamily A
MADLKECRESVADLFGRAAQQADFEAKGKLMAAFQLSGTGKAKSVACYLLDWLSGSSNQKILVFAHHKAVLDTIDKALMEKYPNSHIRIDGSVPTLIRAQLVKRFQTCERVRVGLLSMTAAGVGLTLTAASTVLFAELHWTPGVLAQCEDRAHRIGQRAGSVQILYMVCKDPSYSVDSSIWEMLGRKISTLDALVDGKEVRGELTCSFSSFRAMPLRLQFVTCLDRKSHISSRHRSKVSGGRERVYRMSWLASSLTHLQRNRIDRRREHQ